MLYHQSMLDQHELQMLDIAYDRMHWTITALPAESEPVFSFEVRLWLQGRMMKCNTQWRAMSKGQRVRQNMSKCAYASQWQCCIKVANASDWLVCLKRDPTHWCSSNWNSKESMRQCCGCESNDNVACQQTSYYRVKTIAQRGSLLFCYNILSGDQQQACKSVTSMLMATCNNYKLLRMLRDIMAWWSDWPVTEFGKQGWCPVIGSDAVNTTCDLVLT